MYEILNDNYAEYIVCALKQIYSQVERSCLQFSYLGYYRIMCSKNGAI